MQKYYTAKMDRLLRLTTRVVWAVFMIPPAAMWINYSGPGVSGTPPAHYPASIFGVFLCMAAIAWTTRAMSPRGFTLDDIELRVDRAMRPISIRLSDITEARMLVEGEFKGSLRLMGASGFYGHYGLFWNKALGRYRLYACRSKNLVLVRTAKNLFVLGPDSPEEFLSDLRGLISR